MLYNGTRVSIPLKNAEGVSRALESVLPPRAYARHLTHDELVGSARRVEELMAGYTHTVEGFVGTRVVIRGGRGDSAHRPVIATCAVIERRQRGWTLIEVSRQRVWAQHEVQVYPTPIASDEYVVNQVSRRASGEIA